MQSWHSIHVPGWHGGTQSTSHHPTLNINPWIMDARPSPPPEAVLHRHDHPRLVQVVESVQVVSWAWLRPGQKRRGRRLAPAVKEAAAGTEAHPGGAGDGDPPPVTAATGGSEEGGLAHRGRFWSGWAALGKVLLLLCLVSVSRSL